jgi:hypothetical protein
MSKPLGKSGGRARLRAAVKAAEVIGLDAADLLERARNAEFHWQGLVQELPDPDAKAEMLAYLLSRNPFKYPILDPLEAPSARDLVRSLRFLQAKDGGTSKSLKAVADALRFKRRGFPTSMLKELTDRTDLELYRGMLRQLKFADKNVPGKLKDEKKIRDALTPKWAEAPPLFFDNSFDDLARHLAASRASGHALPDQAALWLLERRRRQDDRAAPTERDVAEACRLRDRLLKAEVRNRKTHRP